MRKAYLLLAAGMFAGLGFAAPCHANIIVETEANFTLTGTGTITASDLEFTYSAGVLPPIGDAITVNSTDLSGLSAFSSGNILTIDFTPQASGNIDFSFGSTAALGTAFLLQTDLTGATGSITNIAQESHIVSVTNTVPEPASMVLLGLGIASCVAWRFKRSVAV